MDLKLIKQKVRKIVGITTDKRSFMLVEALIVSTLITGFVYGTLVGMPAVNGDITGMGEKLQALSLAKYEAEVLYSKNIAELQAVDMQPVKNMPGFYKTVTLEDIPNGKKVTVVIKYPKGMISVAFEKKQSVYER